MWFLYLYGKNNEVYKYIYFIYFKISVFLVIMGLFYLVISNPISLWIAFDFMVYSNFFSYYCFLIFLIMFLVYLIIFIILDMDFFYYFEYLFILMFIILISSILFKTFDLLLFFFLIETLSLCLYILVSSNYTSVKVSEVGVKYFILAVLSSLFMLYAISLIYFYFGSLNLQKIRILFLLENDSYNFSLLIFSVILLFCVFLFKLGIAPFHLWVVEVYVNISYSTFFFLSIFSKYLFFILFLKLFLFFFSFFLFYFYYLILFVSLLSIFIGTVGLFIYIDIKKIIAYGSIIHSGFLMLCFVNFSYYSIYAFFFYLIVYLVLMFNFFLYFFFFKVFDINFSTLNDLIYFKNISIFFSLNFFCIFLSMAGLPPFIGFFIKYFILVSFYDNSFNSFIIVSILLILSILSIYVYLRIGVYLFFVKSKYSFVNVYNFKSFRFLNLGFFCFNLFGFLCSSYIYKYIYISLYYYLTCFI